MTLRRLLYVSRCALPGEGHERDLQVQTIATAAAKRNREAQITGSLLHLGDTFIQVLEGPTAAVERTFEAICCDFRHEDVKLLEILPMQERVFPEWGMALIGGDTETRVKLRDDLEEVRFLAGVNTRGAIAQMRRLLEEHRS